METKFPLVLAHSPELGATSWLIEFRESHRAALAIRSHLRRAGFKLSFGFRPYRGHVYNTINVFNAGVVGADLIKSISEKVITVLVFDHQPDGSVRIRTRDGGWVRASLEEYQQLRREQDSRLSGNGRRYADAA